MSNLKQYNMGQKQITLISVMVSFFLLFNLFVHPYPRELAILDIKTEVNSDAVIAGVLVNLLSVLGIILGWVIIIRSRLQVKWFYVILSLTCIYFFLYWVTFLF